MPCLIVTRTAQIGAVGSLRPLVRPQCRQRRRPAAQQGEPSPPSDPPPPERRLPLESPPDAPANASPPEVQPDLQLPRDVVERLRTTVFGFDTFFVTSLENYEANGVLFRGNLRGGDPARAYAKLRDRLRQELGAAYTLYLLEDQEERPVAVVLPADAARVQVPGAAEAALAALFGATTVLTTLNVNASGTLFNLALLAVNPDPSIALSALPGTAALLAVLAAHELGHKWAAKQHGLELAPPLLIPAGLGLLGSFGAVTRIKSPVPDRDALTAVAAAGPAAGTAASLALLAAGLLLTAGGVGGIELDTSSFRDSLLVGALGTAVFGQQLFAAEAINANPLLVAGWAGLIITALNVLPAGELDGGRLALGLWGRRTASRLSTLAFLGLGLAGIRSALPLFFLLYVLTIQRGPIVPCDEELSSLRSGATRVAAAALLALPLLVLLPFPFGGGGDAGVPLGDLPPL